MSDVEVRVVQTLSPPDSEPLRLQTVASRASTAHWVGQRRLSAMAFFVGDLLAGAVAIVVAALIVNIVGPDGRIALSYRLHTEMSATLSLLIGMWWLLGLYRSSTNSLIERFQLRATATLLFVFGGMLMAARDGATAELAIPPLAGAMALVLGSWIEHLINARLRRSGAWGAPTAILGTGSLGRTFARLLISQPAWGLRPVGYIDDGAYDGDDSKEAPCERDEDEAAAMLPLLGTLEGWRMGSGAEVVVVPDCHALPQDPTVLYRLGVRHILVVNQLGDLPSLGLQVRHFDRFIGLEVGGRPRNPSHGLKRTIDLAIALPLAVLTGPFIGLLALAIKLTDPGPAFYGQQRIGRFGRPIQVLKLRTMYRDAEQRLQQVLATDAGLREQWQRYFKLPHDPRILPHVGAFLRRTSLDELPQLWNVIRGDMSLVGPRPLPAYHMDAFDREFQVLRATVPPGLTGLWQISSRSDGDLGVQRAQDCFYIRNRSLWLDLYILIATLPAVIGGQGAR